LTLILGIETSCDETAAAVVESARAVRSNVVASQHHLHEQYKGVVPEIASRAHLERITPVINEAVKSSGVAMQQIDAIAVGNRPGLIGSLMVGVSAAKAIAWAMDKPLIGVDHVQAHLYAPLLKSSDLVNNPDLSLISSGPPVFPALGLVVSGGHSSLYFVDSPTQMQLLGRTIDDAIGEAYDKAAVILELGYPGGPEVDRLAQTGDGQRYNLPRSMLSRDSLDFSFSGLKTALLYTVRGHPRGRGPQARFERCAQDLTDIQRADLAASFQMAAIDSVLIKLNRAIDQLVDDGRPPRSVLIGGGVSANSLLRSRVIQLGQQRHLDVHLPTMAYCLDNAAMIAGLAFHYWEQQALDDLDLPAIATTGR